MKSRTYGKNKFTINHHGKKISGDREENESTSYSFVLTRHVHNTPKRSIPFFILHLHLLCYEHFTRNHKIDPPPYLKNNSKYFIDTDKCDGGTLVGGGTKLRMFKCRDPNGTDNVTAIIRKGTEISFPKKDAYNYSPSSGLVLVKIVDPQKVTVPESTIMTGFEEGEGRRLRIIPNEKIYKKYGELYRHRVKLESNLTLGLTQKNDYSTSMHMPLFIGRYHVGFLIPGATVFLKSLPVKEDDNQEVIHDNISSVVLPEKYLEYNSTDVPGALPPPSDDVVTLKSAIQSLGKALREQKIAAPSLKQESLSVKVEKKRSGSFRCVLEKDLECFSRFLVNTAESNQCGLSALDGSGVKLIDIPYWTEIDLVESITMEGCVSKQKRQIKPITIQQPEYGYINSEEGFYREEVNDVSANFDQVEVFNEPIPIRGGELLAYVGEQNASNLVHMELWLPDVDFVKNPEKQSLLSPPATIPAGTPATMIKSESRFGCAKLVAMSPDEKFIIYRRDRLTKEEQGKNSDIRKIKHKNSYYFIYQEDVDKGAPNNNIYIRFNKETTVSLYEHHPEVPSISQEYVESSIPVGVQLKELPAAIYKDGKKLYPVIVNTKEASNEEVKTTYLIEESRFKDFCSNAYDWEKYFKVTNIDELSIEKSGLICEERSVVEKRAKVLYDEAVEGGQMHEAPNYQSQHPLSHLIVRGCAEWSKSEKERNNWADAVLTKIWELANVSSIEADKGITMKSAEAAFEKTIQQYSDSIDFYDELSSVKILPPSNQVTYAHPLRFLNHIDHLGRGRVAPWLEFAWQEYGQSEGEKRIENRNIVEYFASTTFPAESDEVFWCSAFANWVMTQAGYQGTQSAKAIDWLEWEGGKILKRPIVGAMMIVHYNRYKGDTSGHVGFVVGQVSEVNGAKLVILGGNQGNKVKTSSYDPNYAKIKGYVIPKDYPVRDYELPVVTPEDEEELSHSATR